MTIASKLQLLLCTVICILFAEFAKAQTIKGKVFEMGTRNTISSAAISIKNKADRVYTDTNGNFQIKAAINDLIVVSAGGYISDTILLTNLNFKQIYLRQIERWLSEVKITANNAAAIKSFKYQDPNFHNQTVKKQMDDEGNYKGGVTLRLWYWKKDEKKKKKIEKIIADAETATVIDKLFCKDTIQKYIPVGDDEVTGFVDRYKPTVAAFRANSFNLFLYLNTAYKSFIKLPKDERMRFNIF